MVKVINAEFWDLLFLFFIFILLPCLLIYQVISKYLYLKRNKVLLAYLRESSRLSGEISTWIKNHKDELAVDPIKTLNQQALFDLVNQAQAIDDRIIELDPEYRDIFISPIELHCRMIEIARREGKQTP